METSMGRNSTSTFGNSARARDMYRGFNGAELSSQQMFESGDPQAVVQTLAQVEWGRIAAEILPPQIVEALKPIAYTLAEKFASFIDTASERLHAQELRDNFGEPQSPAALPVLNSLTIMLEEGFQAEIQAAREAKSVMEWLRQQVRETILVWHLLQVSKQEANLKELEEVEQNITAQGAVTQFATAEANSMTKAIQSHKEVLKKGLQTAQEKLLAFVSGLFTQNLGTAEKMIYQAPNSVVIPSLNAEKAIPVTAADLAQAR